MAAATVWFGAFAMLSGICGQGGLARSFAGMWGRALLRLWGVEVLVEGVPPQGPAVYAANHGSALDIPIVFGYLPVDFRVIHKRSLHYLPILGQYLYLGGHIAVDRGNPFRARRSLSRAALRIRAGTSVLVFPEGTRNRRGDGAVQPFKRGSFVLAVEAGVPVVPVSLSGVKRIAPDGMLRMRPGRVVLTLHAAMSTEGLAFDDAGAFGDRVQAVVAAACRADAA
ncbi:MAG: lysophospholipid acyltransferase family protein [Vicinamibacteria bacterium]